MGNLAAILVNPLRAGNDGHAFLFIYIGDRSFRLQEGVFLSGNLVLGFNNHGSLIPNRIHIPLANAVVRGDVAFEDQLRVNGGPWIRRM